MTGSALNNWNIGIEKSFRMREARRIQFRAEFFDAWNHAQFENPDNTVGNITFGRVTKARRAREVQFGLKLLW